MEKTLKRLLLLIPILIIAFPLKNVYADEPIDIYFNVLSSIKNEYASSPTSDVSYSSSFTFNAYNQDFKVNINPSTRLYYNSFVLYNRSLDVYIINVITPGSRFPFSDTRNINIKCDPEASINKYMFQFLNNENIYVDYNSNSWPGLLMNFQSSNVWSSLLYGNYISELSFQNYYLQFNPSSVSSAHSYCDTLDDYDLIYIDSAKLFINGVEKELYIPPEPEPETPSVPPYIFNNTKYYVPNYDERNCVEIIDKDTIRVFENEESIDYTDYYINSNYISKKGQVEVSYVKNCSNLQFTNIRYYGNDFPQILFITLVVITFSVGFPYILYKRFRKR